MKINKKFTKAARRMLSVAVCLVMMFTTFFIFDPAVLSELFPKASAWNFTSYATSTNGDKAGLSINTSAKTVTVNTSNGFAYFLSHMTSEFQGYTVTLNTDVYMQPSQGVTRVNYDYSDSDTTAWYGVLDGNGHCISNYYHDYNSDPQRNMMYHGIIRKMSGGIVRNLTVLNSHVYSRNSREYDVGRAGGLIGAISSDSCSYSDVKIENVTVSGAYVNVTSGGKAERNRGCGGIVGEVAKKTTFTNCNVVSSKIQTDNGGERQGGFIGQATASVTIENNENNKNGIDENGRSSCLSNTTIFHDDWNDVDHGGFIGWTSGDTTINNVIAESTVYSGDTCGGLIGYTNGNVTITNSIVKGTVKGKQYGAGFVGLADSYEKDNTVTINNCTNYAYINSRNDNAGGFIGRAVGAISLTDCNNQGSVTNNGNTTAGGIIGWIQNGTRKTSFVNCTNKGSVTSGKDYAGGIIGADDGTGFGTVSNAHNFGAITGGRYAGGIVGRTTRQMKLLNCVNESSATITTTTNNKKEPDTCAGGIIGKNQDARQVVIENCTNNGSVKASRDYAGGIMGYLDASKSGATFKNCVNNGSVKNGVSAGAWYAGGILAASGNNNPVTFENCRNNVDVGNATNYTGGITGYVKGPLTMKNSVNTGNISGAQFTAGLCAWIEDDGCEITNCLNTGSVSGSGNSNVAGILSTIQRQTRSSVWKITNTVNTGAVSGKAAVGGILGWLGQDGDTAASVTIENCINKADITGTGADVGGVICNLDTDGKNHKIINCINYGKVYTNATDKDVYVGGIVAKERGFGAFENCINYGKIEISSSTNTVAGGICGWIQDDTSSFANCVNYGAVSAKNNVGGILGEINNAYKGTTFSFTQCGNYGNLTAKASGTALMGGIVGKLWAKENTVKIYLSKCFNGNGVDGGIAATGDKAQYAGGLIGGVNQDVYILDSYNNAPKVIGSASGAIIGYNEGHPTYLHNSYSATSTPTAFIGKSTVTTPTYIYTSYNEDEMSTGTGKLSSLNTSRTVTGISSVGNSYVYKVGVNEDYPVLSWQVDVLTKNVGRNLIADLIADTAKSGFKEALGTDYSIKIDGVTKNYHSAYTKTVDGITITYDTLTDTVTLNGECTPNSSTMTFFSLAAPSSIDNVTFSAYYVGGSLYNVTETNVYGYAVNRTRSQHYKTSISQGTIIEIGAKVNSGNKVVFDNYKLHASIDYVNNAVGSYE